MASGKPKVESIEVPELDIRQMRITVQGTAPLVTHAWSQKAKRQMEEKQSGKPRQGTRKSEARNPEEEFQSGMYWTEDGRPGVPARCFRAAMISAAPDVGAFKTTMKRAFWVEGEILPIEGSEPVMRTDFRRLESGVADLVYRPMYEKWRVTLNIRYNAKLLSPAHLVNLLRTAGFGVGICEGRPASPKGNGMGWGTFEVVSAQDEEEA